MEVNVLPFAISAVPDAGFLRLHGARRVVGIHVLSESDVSDAGAVLADQMHVRIQQDGVDGFVTFRETVFKVESVEIRPLHKVSQSFRFK